MKILQILRKLGILRFGAVSATYTRADEIPSELLMDDVYDAKSDLLSNQKAPAEKDSSAGDG